MPLWKAGPVEYSGSPRPALFLDRDGVIIADRHYLSDPQQVEILPGVCQALIRARQAGYLLIGVSNQSGMGRGVFGLEEFEAVMEKLDWLLEKEGSALDAFFYCPHAPGDGCHCRKPLRGMLDEASEILNWRPAGSWVVGDKHSDIALGRDAGLGAALVLTGYGLQQEEKVRQTWPNDSLVGVFDDLPLAVDHILENTPFGELS
jgi:histidinol-phosphate phosphatase family protein